ncbi:MAG: hypothetical protein NTX03_11105 [Bacteroidetes bacterium]|nr:hypothetical protein [Bacteroidota bacterium]
MAFIIFLLGITLTSHAQEVLVGDGEFGKPSKTSADSLKIPKVGPNRTHYFDLIVPIEKNFGTSGKGIQISWWNSFNIGASIRYKLKLNGLLDVGADAGYKYCKYGYNTSKAQAFPDVDLYGLALTHSWQKLGFHTAPVSAFVRINFNPKRGDIVGNYLALGITSSYILGSDYVVTDKGVSGTKQKIKTTSLPYFNSTTTNVFAQLRFTKLITFVGSYRFTDYLKPQYSAAELPRYSAGLILNLSDGF